MHVHGHAVRQLHGQVRSDQGRAGQVWAFHSLLLKQVLKRYKVLSRLQEKNPGVQLLNEILVMEKSKKKTQWFGTFLQRNMLLIRLRSWKRTTSGESCHRSRQTPSWSLNSDEKTKRKISLILVGMTGWVETNTIEISNSSSNEVWDANPDPDLNWVFNRGKQSSEHYTVEN